MSPGLGPTGNGKLHSSWQCWQSNIYMSIYICIYMYIYIDRERERVDWDFTILIHLVVSPTGASSRSFSCQVASSAADFLGKSLEKSDCSSWPGKRPVRPSTNRQTSSVLRGSAGLQRLDQASWIQILKAEDQSIFHDSGNTQCLFQSSAAMWRHHVR